MPDPGASANLKTASSRSRSSSGTWSPTGLFQAMAQNEILQMVVLLLFFGIAITQIPGTANIVKTIDKFAHIILRITDYVMKYAPIAVFAAIAAIIKPARRAP